jgi:hypothetical protein
MDVQNTANQKIPRILLASLEQPAIVLFSLIIAAELLASQVCFAQAPSAAHQIPPIAHAPQVSYDVAKLASSELPDLKEYLAAMRPPMHLYLHIMLSIISPDGLPADDSLETSVTPQNIKGLQDQLAYIKPPAELIQQHAALDKSLNAVAQFVGLGGASKNGFHSALQLAQQMQATSNSYHNSVLAVIQEHGLANSSDPFIVEKLREKAAPTKGKKVQSSKPTVSVQVQSQAPYAPQVTPSDRMHGLSGSAAGVDFDAGSKIPSSASTTPTMIDGVGGSMGLSGMFNGLGGTGTNGLVDGMGFSSGLNGFVNGAGASSGMSGMLNDINTSSASGNNK